MYDLGVPDGLGAMGYTNADVEQLVKGDLETLFVTITEIFSRKNNLEAYDLVPEPLKRAKNGTIQPFMATTLYIENGPKNDMF